MRKPSGHSGYQLFPIKELIRVKQALPDRFPRGIGFDAGKVAAGHETETDVEKAKAKTRIEARWRNGCGLRGGGTHRPPARGARYPIRGAVS
jgi:hypothetical protein